MSGKEKPGAPGAGPASPKAGEDAAAPEAAPGPDVLKAEIEKLKHEYLLQRADFENMRRRMDRQKQEELKYAALPLVRELVVVIDTLELALSHAPQDDPMRQGVAMVLDGMLKTLGRFGVERIKSVGQVFDPTKHEALASLCDPARADNTVLEERRPGYLFHERLVRPAGVAVNRFPHPQEAPEAARTPPE